MCTHDRDITDHYKCCICQDGITGDPGIVYNKRIGGWMCSICVLNTHDKLMAYLRRKQEKEDG